MASTNPQVHDLTLLSANKHLLGRTTLEIFDEVVAACTSARLMVVLDNHMSDNEWLGSLHQNGLWYNDRWSEATWIETHMAMAMRYRHDGLVVAAELRNELRPAWVGGRWLAPTWGGNVSGSNWHAAATRAGEAVLMANPNLLIVVDGLHWSTDLTSVSHLPVTLSRPNRVVYSAHNFGWFTQPADYEGMRDQLDRQWGYIAGANVANFTAPIWVSEFGTWSDPAKGTLDKGWFPLMVRYLKEKDFDWGYWCGDGTQSRGASRVFGADAGFGILNMTWNGPANEGVLLDKLKTIQQPVAIRSPLANSRGPLRPFVVGANVTNSPPAAHPAWVHG